jgi:hypothetical protein
MNLWVRVGLAGVLLGSAAAPVTAAAVQADVTTPTYSAPAADPWYGYKLRLAQLARQQGVREATIQANVPG